MSLNRRHGGVFTGIRPAYVCFANRSRYRHGDLDPALFAALEPFGEAKLRMASPDVTRIPHDCRVIHERDERAVQTPGLSGDDADVVCAFSSRQALFRGWRFLPRSVRQL